MITEHTSGPWHIGTREAHYCVYDTDGWWIADASPLGKAVEAKANARLITAAPDLLKALEATWNALNNFTTGRIHYPTTVPEVEQMAREAIAKARGLTP